ncbi:unnamed protein product [Ilex paraguariensis]|uniref:Uncharacterized protein n=1 Tax=Ilex paraguariensis TaxID=185542 RepID=A0ABC8QVI2_9AQUA
MESASNKRKRMISLSTRLKTSEDDKKTIHIDLIKSKDYICGLEEEKKPLQDKVSFLESEFNGFVETKKSLELKLIKLNRDLHESQELCKRLFLSTKKLNKMLFIGKSVGDKRGLGYTNENITFSPSKTMFVKGYPNPSPPRVHKRVKMVRVCIQRSWLKRKPKPKNLSILLMERHCHYSMHGMHDREVLDKKLMHLANQYKALNNQFIHLKKLMETSSESKHTHVSSSKRSQARVRKTPSTPKIKVDLHILEKRELFLHPFSDQT